MYIYIYIYVCTYIYIYSHVHVHICRRKANGHYIKNPLASSKLKLDTRMNESYHISECVMSNMGVSHVTHWHESSI